MTRIEHGRSGSYTDPPKHCWADVSAFLIGGLFVCKPWQEGAGRGMEAEIATGIDAMELSRAGAK